MKISFSARAVVTLVKNVSAESAILLLFISPTAGLEIAAEPSLCGVLSKICFSLAN
jgi:hypothetical protein